MDRQIFNTMWNELWTRVYSKVPGVTKGLSDTAAGIVKKYLYPTGKVRVISQNLLVDENSVTARMEIERYEGSSGTASVDFYTADGPIVPSADKKNAVKGVDYVESVGKVSWADGDTGTKFVDISIIDDVIYEDGEVRYLTFGIKNPVGVVLGNVTKLELGIKDNEIKPINRGKVRINTTNTVVDENSSVVKIDVERFDGSDEAISVDFNTVDGTAKAGIDYVGNAGKLEWKDQEAGIKSINISIIDDIVFENNETKYFDFKIMAPATIVLENNTVNIGIRDNEINVPPPTLEAWQLKLVGGLRLEEGFCRGQFTIDHQNNRLYMQDMGNGTSVFDITGGYTVGTDFNTFRKLKPIEKIPAWWPKSPTAEATYAGSYMMRNGKLWAVLKNFYDTNPKHETVLLARDGEKITVNGLRGQAFGGLVKPATGDPLLGSGGNDSGSGGSFGPTLGTLAGVNLVDYPFSNIAWENRAPRPANYFRLPLDAQDVWFCCNPRDTDGDGVAEGKWAADQIYGSGVIHSTGIYRWVTLGVDEINYNFQSRCLAKQFQNVVYRYHPVTFELLDIINWSTEGVHSGNAKFIAGAEMSSDGKYLYVMQCNMWKSGIYTVDPVLFVYEIQASTPPPLRLKVDNY